MIEPITPQQFANNLTLIALAAVKHLAITLNECYGKFWSREPQVIVDCLNANIPLAMQRFHANTAIGTAANAQLEAAGESLRVIVTMPDGYSFNGVAFEYVAPITNPEPLENDENV